MIQIALTIILVSCSFRFFDKEQLFDGSNTVFFVLVPATLILIVNAVLASLGAPAWAFSATQLGYLLVPFYFLTVIIDYSFVKAAAYASGILLMSQLSHWLVAYI